MTQQLSQRRYVGCFAVLGFLVLSVLLMSVPVRAQVAGATLSGTVTDPSGAVVAGAKVTIRNTATGVSRDVTADSVGFYSTPNLMPGAYEVTTTAPGFSTQTQRGITLTVGGTQVLNITLQVGQVTQTVEVTGAAMAVELSSSSITNDVNSATVRELPLNGRDWTSLAALQPGVSNISSLQPTAASGYGRGNRGYGNELSISGGRPQQNNYRIDGISANDYANSGPGSVIGGALGVDGIQEFSVVSSNYSAEYGRTSGGVVNAVTRAGTNAFHGDGFEFIRNSRLDARNFFDPATIPAFKRNQFGGALGGPIVKDKTFFFGDYEGIRQGLGQTRTPKVFSQDARNGIIHNSDGSTCTIGVASAGCTTLATTLGEASIANSAGTVGVDPLSAPYLAAWPLPTTTDSSGNTGVASIGATEVVSENYVSVRIDHQISQKDSLFGTYQQDTALLSNPDSMDDNLNGNASRRHFLALEENHTFGSSLVNNVRFGYNRVEANNSFGVRADNPFAGNLAFGLAPGRYAPSVSLSNAVTGFGGGLNTPIGYHWWWNSFQGYDDAFLTKGIHALKFGFAVERDQDNVFGQGAGYAAWTFKNIPDFLQNKPSGFSALLSGQQGFGVFGYRQTIYGAYVQDDIRWRPNLTVNVGVRYEMSTEPTEVKNNLANIQSITNTGNPILGAPYFHNPTYNDIAPRVGFAWDPFHNGKTSVRGGFGIFDILPLVFGYAIPSFSGAPFNVAGTSQGAINQGLFPSGLALNSVAAANLTRVTLVEFHPKRDYAMQWNLSIQRQLQADTTLTVAYVGSHGVHLPFASDSENEVIPTLTSAGYLWPNPKNSANCTGAQVVPNCFGNPVNTGHGRIDTRAWGNSSFFHALEVQVSKSMSHGFQAGGAYTWSKSIDYGSGSIAGDPFANSIAALPYYFDPRLDRGPSDFNVTQNLTMNVIWSLPTPHSMSGGASMLVSGWQLGSIFSWNTGTPFTPIDNLAGSGALTHQGFPSVVPGCGSLVNSGSVTNYINLNCFSVPTVPASFDPTGTLCQAAVGIANSCLNLGGNVGRNSVPGPKTTNLDFSMTKNTFVPKISESFNVQFRAEFFNILNHANFLAPIDNSTLFNSDGSRVGGAGAMDAPTSTTSRQIQFGLKIIF